MIKYHRIDYCPVCGTKLDEKIVKNEGLIKHCPRCDDLCFPVFHVACSMIVLDEKKENALLVKQYGKDYYVLVAGYVNQGEEPEHAVAREIKEETGLDVISLKYNKKSFRSYFFREKILFRPSYAIQYVRFLSRHFIYFNIVFNLINSNRINCGNIWTKLHNIFSNSRYY